MTFVIVTTDGEVLADITGWAFTFQSKADAQCFLMPGEDIEQVEDDQIDQTGSI